MKKYVKLLYMLVFHPWIFITNTCQNGLFIKRRSDIKKIEKACFGNRVTFGYDTRINFFDSSTDKKLFIGDDTYICNRNTILCGGTIRIAKNVLIASDVCITSENHSTNPESEVPYMKQNLIFGDVIIEDNTWIGEKTIILPGVKIGKNSVIGAGSVVTKSVPEYSIAVGNPAHIIKKYNKLLHKWEKVI